jgi:hypothetical protein
LVGTLPRLAALIFPALVLVGSALVIDRAAQQGTSADNVRRLNGRTLDRPLAVVLDDRLDREPEVVVIGNSIVYGAIHRDDLAQRLGLRSDQVAVLSLPGTLSAHWYAVLSQRVFARGHRPALVVVASSLQSMLESTPTSTGMWSILDALGGTQDPVVQRTLGRVGGTNLAARVRAGRLAVRSRFIDQVRGGWVGAVWAADADDPVGQGNALVDLASATELQASRVDVSMVRRSVAAASPVPVEVPPPELSFAAEMARIGREYDTKVVFVRTPPSPFATAADQDRLAQGTEAAMARMAMGHGARFVDLGALELGALAYEDPLHMNDVGAKRFTRVVADRLIELDAHRRGIAFEDVRFPALSVGKAVIWGEGSPPHVVVERATALELPPGRGFQEAPRGMAVFHTPGFTELFDGMAKREPVAPAGCSPLAVQHHGVMLQPHTGRCGSMKNDGVGRSCFDGVALFFTSPDGRTPAPGALVRLAYDEGRSCGPMTWALPGDTLVVRLSAAELVNQAGGPLERLTAQVGVARGYREVGVEVRVDGVSVLQEQLDSTDNRVDRRLGRPILDSDSTVEVRVHNASARGIALVQSLVLHTWGVPPITGQRPPPPDHDRPSPARAGLPSQPGAD